MLYGGLLDTECISDLISVQKNLTLFTWRRCPGWSGLRWRSLQTDWNKINIFLIILIHFCCYCTVKLWETHFIRGSRHLFKNPERSKWWFTYFRRKNLILVLTGSLGLPDDEIVWAGHGHAVLEGHDCLLGEDAVRNLKPTLEELSLLSF